MGRLRTLLAVLALSLCPILRAEEPANQPVPILHSSHLGCIWPSDFDDGLRAKAWTPPFELVITSDNKAMDLAIYEPFLDIQGEGKGTTFQLRFPVAEDPGHDERFP